MLPSPNTQRTRRRVLWMHTEGPSHSCRLFGSRAWALKCPSREGQELSCWGCPMQERTPAICKWSGTFMELGAASQQPTGIEQGNDPTGLTTHLRAEIQQNMAALGPSSVQLEMPQGPSAPRWKLCAPPRAQPSYHCPGLSELSLLVFALTWRSNDVNVYLGGFLPSRGLVSSDVTGSVFSFPWEAGSGTVTRGQRLLLLQQFLRVLWRPWLSERTSKSCLVIDLGVRFFKVCFISKVDLLHYRWVRKPDFDHG